MHTGVVIVLVVLLVFAILILLLGVMLAARRAGRGVDPTQLLFDPELIGRVRTLAEADRKLPAIKLLRDGTPGLGLAAAKIMVDKMAAAPPRRPEQPPAVDLSKDGDDR